MENDVNKLKEAFLIEADMHIKVINNALVALEKKPSDKKLFHEVFRGIHTIKSLAATMSYENTMSICHAIEDLMEEIRNKNIKLNEVIDLIFQAIDYLNDNLKLLEDDKDELNADILLNELHNMLGAKMYHQNSISNLTKENDLTIIKKMQTVTVKVDKLDTLMNLAEELLVQKLKFDLIKEQISHPDLNPAVESLGRLISDLQYYVLQVRLVPIGFVFNRFIRLVRDLAKQEGKLIDLQIEGGDIELDRLLLDEIGASIAHLVKNAVDHGIESPEVRRKLNKPERATIKLRAERTKEYAIIEVTDDGAGLDLSAIKKAAREAKLFETDLVDEELLNTIFLGISTTKFVTEVSGRGLGLSIVKQQIESIGGTIKVQSTPGKFTSFFMEIPLTLAIIKTLFVKVDGDIYAIPIEAVERLLAIPAENFKWLLNDETIIFQNEDIPVIRLATLFGYDTSPPKNQAVVLISKGKSRLGLAVDALLSTQEVVIKPLSKPLKNNKYFSGAAMIGSGQMVLIIDAGYLLSLPNKLTMEAV